MKRTILIIVAILTLVLLLCSCGKDEITVEYKATEGGQIIGKATQTKELGKSESVVFDVVMVVADEGYRFTGWSDGKADTTRIDSLSSSATFVASFERIAYGTISYTCEQGGSIVGTSTQRLEVGQTTTEVKAEPKEGYRFIAWSDGVEEPTRTDLVDGDKTISAIFSNKVTITYLATEGGFIFGTEVQEVECGESGRLIQAIERDGYRFVGWDDNNLSVTRTDTAEKDVTYTAIFKKYYTIEFICNDKYGTIVGDAKQEGIDGEYIFPVVAKPNAGYKFVCWSNGSTEAKQFFAATENVYMKAYFVREGSELPIVTIDTKGGASISSKTTYVNCVINAYDPNGTGHVFEKDAGIRGRGNSTWTRFDKKPYRIKFEHKQDFFGMGEGKDWVLLANHMDKSLIRNYLAFEAARQLSTLGSTPDCRLVEVYINGDYNGVYVLCEQVEVNQNRVEVEEDSLEADTGYLVEMDGWADGVCVTVPDPLGDKGASRKYSIKYPDNVGSSQAQKDYIYQYLTNCMSAINGTDYEKVKELMDVESFAQAYIIFELFKNPDVDYSSFYMHKDKGGKLMCGPVWDFNMCCGNVSHKGTNCQKYDYLWAKETNPWFNGLLNFEEFRTLVGEQLREYEQQIKLTLEECYSYAYSMGDSIKLNFEKWDYAEETWNPSYILALESWEEQVEFVEDFLENSYAFLLETYP